MEELEELLMEFGIMEAEDESIVGKTAAELAAGRAVPQVGGLPTGLHLTLRPGRRPPPGACPSTQRFATGLVATRRSHYEHDA